MHFCEGKAELFPLGENSPKGRAVYFYQRAKARRRELVFISVS
jgi:hypothetical protein